MDIYDSISSFVLRLYDRLCTKLNVTLPSIVWVRTLHVANYGSQCYICILVSLTIYFDMNIAFNNKLMCIRLGHVLFEK